MTQNDRQSAADDRPPAPMSESGRVECMKCGYDLAGLDPEDSCPECGLSALASVIGAEDRAMTHELARSLRRVLAVRGAALGCWLFVIPFTLVADSTANQGPGLASRFLLTAVTAGALVLVSTLAAVRIWSLERHAPFAAKSARLGRWAAAIPAFLFAALALMHAAFPQVPVSIAIGAWVVFMLSGVLHASLFNGLLLTRAAWLRGNGAITLSVHNRAGAIFFVLMCFVALAIGSNFHSGTLGPTLALAFCVWGTSVYAVSAVQRQLGRWRQRIKRLDDAHAR